MQNVEAVISLKRIEENARKIGRAAGVPLIAVVKDDAYGHGAERVALRLQPYVAGFAVSTADEGAALRCAGITKDILVLTPPLTQEEVLRLHGYGCIATLSSLPALRLCRKGMRAHLAVNTGMNRYGFRPERVGQACREALKAGISAEGIYSHFYDAADPCARLAQQVRFERACRRAAEYFPHLVRHLSATGGAIAGADYDAVRAGIALYGYLPAGFEGRLSVRPAMQVYATVAHTATQLGGGAGYTAEEGHGALYTLRLGYGDGFFRAGLQGAVGKLCMDAAVCDGSARFGRKKSVLGDVSEYARAHGTSEYEVLTMIGKKAERRYEG